MIPAYFLYIIFSFVIVYIRPCHASISNFPINDEAINPITAEPPLIRPPVASTKTCVVELFKNISCDSYTKVSSAPFSIPDSCRVPKWSKIILDVEAWEKGTQYDRFGCLWIGDVEILRTTTPEPTSTGIQWFIEKDVTVYGNYFLSENLTAYMSIPNNVDSTYTGVIYLSAQITFFMANDDELANPLQQFSAQKLPVVIPLTNATSSNTDPFDTMTLTGTESQSFAINSDIIKSHIRKQTSTIKNANKLYNNSKHPMYSDEEEGISSLFIEVYASPHGCEEFYYCNVPSAEADDLGLCGGGVYREIQVYIDGILAGTSYPFPVIYTGGINPFLWRPLTGIQSFDILSHRFDITPFVSLLSSSSDNHQHTINVTVLGNNDQGFWYIDCVLLLNTDTLSSGRVIVQSSLPSYFDSSANVSVDRKANKQENKFQFITKGDHTFNVSSVISYSNGDSVVYSVGEVLTMQNTNSFMGDSIEKTSQETLQTTFRSSRNQHNGDKLFEEISFDRYPLLIESYYAQNDTSFDMQAAIYLNYDRKKLWRSFSNSFNLAWSNIIASNASYNRTLDHTLVYLQEDAATESYLVSHGVDDGKSKSLSCYERLIHALNGTLISDRQEGECILPKGLSFCGYDICGSLGITGVQSITDLMTSSDKDEWIAITSVEAKPLLVSQSKPETRLVDYEAVIKTSRHPLARKH